jgi:hypothetical protein
MIDIPAKPGRFGKPDLPSSRALASRGGTLGVLCVLAWGCCVHNPQGYKQLSQSASLLIEATPWKMYGVAPTRWTLADGRKALVDVDRFSVASGMGMYRSDMEFDVSWDGSAPSLHCETEPAGPDVPETRFGCWSAGDDGPSVQFWMAPGAGCGFRDLDVPSTLTTPACWKGVLTTPVDRYTVEFGHLSRLGSPVGRISWIGRDDQVVLAADIVVDTIIRLFPGGGKQGLSDELILQTIALHWWWHASNPD